MISFLQYCHWKKNRLPTENIDKLSLLKSYIVVLMLPDFFLSMKCAILILGDWTRSEDSAQLTWMCTQIMSLSHLTPVSTRLNLIASSDFIDQTFCHWILGTCILQCDAQNVRSYIIMTAIVLDLLKCCIAKCFPNQILYV